MRIGQMLGDVSDHLRNKIERAERRDKKANRDREIARARRLGKTIRYRRDEE